MSKSKQKEPMGSKAKTYWAIGIVVAILVIALLAWNAWSSRGNKDAVAATVGDQEYSVAEVSYYYTAIANNFTQQAQQYAMYGMDMGYDTSLSASEQFYNEEEGVTYADYFLDSALQELQRVSILCREAETAGYTLSEEGHASFDENMNYLKMYSIQGNMSEESYLKALYGSYMTMDLFQDILTQSILADEYAKVKSQEFTCSQSDLDAYYAENADALDSYEYRYCYINYQAEEKTDEEGNPIEATDEEIAAAMEVAGQNADAMIAEVRSGTEFNVAAAKYVDETSAESYSSDLEYNHKADVLGSTVSSSLSADVSAWVMAAGRTAGEITSIELENTGYCVVQFLGRDKGSNSYQTASYRNILVLAETDENEDGSAALPTDEQLAAAMEQANALLTSWEEGAATADSFAALAAENSADEATKENGGLNEDINRDTLSAALADWLFERGRQPDEAAVIEYTDDTGNVVGYEVIFVESFGEVRWQYQAANALRTEDYNAWYAEIQEAYPAELTDAAQEIPSL